MSQPILCILYIDVIYWDNKKTNSPLSFSAAPHHTTATKSPK